MVKLCQGICLPQDKSSNDNAIICSNDNAIICLYSLGLTLNVHE